MKLETISYLLYFLFFLQLVLFGPVTMFLVNSFFKKYLLIKFYTGGFFIPGFIFYAKNFEFKTSGFNNTDVVKFKAKKIFFWINPLYFFIGKVRIQKFWLIEPNMKYINRIPSIKKIKYMPSIGKVIIASGNIRKGFIDIEDFTAFPVYKTKIENIELENANVDLGVPLRFIFDSEYAYCKIDSGDILSSCENNYGSLQVQGVTWAKLANLDLISIGFLKNKIDLDVSFTHNKNKTDFLGTLGQINRNPAKVDYVDEKKKIEYKFEIDWNDYQLPFDLALKKMIYKLLTGLDYGGALSLTVNAIAEGLSKILNKKKPEQPSPAKEDIPIVEE